MYMDILFKKILLYGSIQRSYHRHFAGHAAWLWDFDERRSSCKVRLGWSRRHSSKPCDDCRFPWDVG